MAITTIIFDFGGVLYKMPDPKRINQWMKLLGLRQEPEVMAILANPNQSQIVKDICLGKISEDQAWGMMHNKLRIKPKTMRRFRNQFFSKRNLNRQLVRFMDELKEDYQLGILSNAGDQTRSLMTEVFHLDQRVDEIIISAEEGVIKPDFKIYQIAMDRLKAEPAQSLFLDDYARNVEAAIDFGMKAVQFVNNKQAIQMIRESLREEE
ncbi:MAG: HAD family phosphatase [Chloroflexota bacterium]|nr:HAD family phosphatase [Chloroflexota bacterium]